MSADSQFELIVDEVEKMNYEEASTRCATEKGGILANIETPLDHALAIDLIRATGLSNQRAWIGLDDKNVEGQFTFQDGSNLSPYFAPWCGANPDNAGGNQNCVFMHPYWSGCEYGWVDFDCSGQLSIAVCRVFK